MKTKLNISIVLLMALSHLGAHAQFSFHNFGRPYGNMVGDVSGQYVMVGTKCRSTEYQAAIGLAQLKRLDEQTEKRNENAEYLKSQIKSIPGILPR